MPNSPVARFGLADAKALMHRPGSRLCTVSIGPHVFWGSWVQKQGVDESKQVHFQVEDVSSAWGQGRS
jgi:hypothetical protein